MAKEIQESTPPGEAAGYSLAHPVYLDVPMMMSFLAHIEGGVALSGSEKTTVTGTTERLLKGRGGFKARLWAIDADLGGERSTSDKDESQTQSETERHHTASSLFNALYGYLRDDHMIHDVAAEQDLADVKAGAMVEVYAQFLGNPLEEILAFFKAFIPYYDQGLVDVEEEDEPQTAPAKKAARSGNPAKRAQAESTVGNAETQALELMMKQAAQAERENTQNGIRIVRQMADDIAAAPVHDLLFDAGEFEAVVTVDSEYYSDTTKENLRSGQFRIVGKVTRVLGEGEEINLARRTVLGVAGPEQTKDIIDSFTSGTDFTLDATDAIVTAPGFQILPMAIFI